MTAHTDGVGWLLRLCGPPGRLSQLRGQATYLGNSAPGFSPPAPLISQQASPDTFFPGMEQEGTRKQTRSLEVQVGNYALSLSPYSIGPSKSHDESQIQEIRK